jgi:hypothetical protein
MFGKLLGKPLGKVVVGGIVAGVAGEVVRPVLERLYAAGVALGKDPPEPPGVGAYEIRPIPGAVQSTTTAIGRGILDVFMPGSSAALNTMQAAQAPQALRAPQPQPLRPRTAVRRAPEPAETDTHGDCGCNGACAACAATVAGSQTGFIPELLMLKQADDQRKAGEEAAAKQRRAAQEAAAKQRNQLDAAKREAARQQAQNQEQIARLQAQVEQANRQTEAGRGSLLRSRTMALAAPPPAPPAPSIADKLADKLLAQIPESPQGMPWAPGYPGMMPPGYPGMMPPGYPGMMPPGYPGMAEYPAQQRQQDASDETPSLFELSDLLAAQMLSGAPVTAGAENLGVDGVDGVEGLADDGVDGVEGLADDGDDGVDGVEGLADDGVDGVEGLFDDGVDAVEGFEGLFDDGVDAVEGFDPFDEAGEAISTCGPCQIR